MEDKFCIVYTLSDGVKVYASKHGDKTDRVLDSMSADEAKASINRAKSLSMVMSPDHRMFTSTHMAQVLRAPYLEIVDYLIVPTSDPIIPNSIVLGGAKAIK